jgi:hypothetical protein
VGQPGTGRVPGAVEPHHHGFSGRVGGAGGEPGDLVAVPAAGRHRLWTAASCVVTAFPVPRYPAETAPRGHRVRNWISKLPAIVTCLARRWPVRVGEPFQPGGQCSWVRRSLARLGQPGAQGRVPVPRRRGGDEAAGLRLRAGNGPVRLHAAHQSESAYALVMARCVPGTRRGQVLPEPGQDLVVIRLLSQLWVQPPATCPFRPLARTAGAAGSPIPGSRHLTMGQRPVVSVGCPARLPQQFWATCTVAGGPSREARRRRGVQCSAAPGLRLRAKLVSIIPLCVTTERGAVCL